MMTVLALVSSIASAVCPERMLTPPSGVALNSDSVLIVVHASSMYDARLATKYGVDAAVAFAKTRGMPVIYLQDGSPEQLYFMDDCAPDHWVHSEGGEVRFDVLPRHVYLAGGHLEICLSMALHQILEQWGRRPLAHRSVTFLMDAIYSNGREVESTDPYYSDFFRFINVIAYGRPGSEQWPKLSLLETLGTMAYDDMRWQYLQRILPHWERSIPEGYRVEFGLNGWSPRQLQRGAGWNPPVLSFRFVDSAVTLSMPACTVGFGAPECGF